MSRPTVTAALIALNEAANLRGWLAAHAWADERLIVDGGSTDGTLEIARSAGARVLQGRFADFAQQRNRALAASRSDWVLFTDADERPTGRLVADLRRRLAGCREHSFRVCIRSSIFGRPFRFSGTQDDCRVRLVRRGRARWRGEVHETLHAPGPCGELAGWLEHLTLPDLASMLAKINRYTSLAAEARVAAGQPPRGCATWLAPARELFRRLLWKQGWLDGPEGLAFAVLSALSAWVQERKHRQLWQTRVRQTRAEAAVPANRHRLEAIALQLCAGAP